MSVAILERRVGDVVVLDVMGQMTIESQSRRLAQQVERCVEEGHRGFVLNLAEVPYSDTTGITALVLALRHVQLQEGVLVLAGVQPRVRRMLETARLLSSFDVVDDVECGTERVGKQLAARTTTDEP